MSTTTIWALCHACGAIQISEKKEIVIGVDKFNIHGAVERAQSTTQNGFLCTIRKKDASKGVNTSLTKQSLPALQEQIEKKEQITKGDPRVASARSDEHELNTFEKPAGTGVEAPSIRRWFREDKESPVTARLFMAGN